MTGRAYLRDIFIQDQVVHSLLEVPHVGEVVSLVRALTVDHVRSALSPGTISGVVVVVDVEPQFLAEETAVGAVVRSGGRSARRVASAHGIAPCVWPAVKPSSATSLVERSSRIASCWHSRTPSSSSSQHARADIHDI